VLGIHAFGRVVFEKLPQSLVLEALDHVSPIVMLLNVKPHFTYVKRYFT
jgi:hypothetical protein